MGILNTIEALLKLGLPCLLGSWVVFHWLFAEGRIGRDVRHKALGSELKKNRKALRKSDDRKVRLIYNRWAWFGGGFYGLAGLWTFLVIEASELIAFLGSGRYLSAISGDLLDLIISFLINQLTNSLQALLWFSYWPGPGDSMLIWIAAGYLGYWCGIELARRQLSPTSLWQTNNEGQEPDN